MHVDYYGREPIAPFALEKFPTIHTHFIPLPNWPNTFGGKILREMYGERGDALATSPEVET